MNLPGLDRPIGVRRHGGEIVDKIGDEERAQHHAAGRFCALLNETAARKSFDPGEAAASSSRWRSAFGSAMNRGTNSE